MTGYYRINILLLKMGSPLSSIPDTAGLGKVFFTVEVHNLIRVHTSSGSTSLSKSLIISGP